MHSATEIFKKEFTKKLMYMFAEDVSEASPLHKYFALATLVKEYASEKWLETNKQYTNRNVKQVYYFSLEFLIGRLLSNNLLNLGIKDTCEKGLDELGINLNELEECEMDAGLGNGGLGRLAACFLDSMASLGIPGHGCGIRYNYGFFEQKIVNGYQVEIPDNWLRDGNVWEVRKENKSVIVNFGGKLRQVEKNGRLNFVLENYSPVLAVPYDTPVIGYRNNTVNTLRLWSAEPVDKSFDFSCFSRGDYLKAVEYKSLVESISQVLYPDDSNKEGRLLRLKQQYFFVSAGIQSILRRFKKGNHPIRELDKYVAIHINDTHPSLAVAELMRILIDEEELDWDDAWRITKNVMAYTNHSILAEALEKWPAQMFKPLLPRIYMIIEEINRRFCNEIIARYPGNNQKIDKMEIINNGSVKMANLAIVGSHSVNGVAKLHTEILKNRELADFYQMFPEKFNNKTNGITHRRWLINANPSLTKLICNTIGNSWIKEPLRLKQLEKFADDTSFQEKASQIKLENKIAFANQVKKKYGINVDPHSMFDVQVKRLHAYKRQVLNAFNIMNLYNKLLENPDLDIVPRTFFFGAKASPSYHLAKQIIKLINSIAYKVNNDKRIKDKIKVVFLENYRVTLAEKIIPCAEVSEQISTASKEASGTSNMKFMMNGAIALATLDGANVEIRDLVGDDNIVTFGLTANQVLDYYKYGGYSSKDYYKNDLRINKIINQMMNGFLDVSNYDFNDIYNSLINDNDEFFVLKDFDDYVKAQDKIDNLYRNKFCWQKMSIINIANSGAFSSDNTIKQYASEIWDTKPINIKL